MNTTSTLNSLSAPGNSQVATDGLTAVSVPVDVHVTNSGTVSRRSRKRSAFSPAKDSEIYLINDSSTSQQSNIYPPNRLPGKKQKVEDIPLPPPTTNLSGDTIMNVSLDNSFSSLPASDSGSQSVTSTPASSTERAPQQGTNFIPTVVSGGSPFVTPSPFINTKQPTKPHRSRERSRSVSKSRKPAS